MITLIIDGDGIAWKAASVAGNTNGNAGGMAGGMVKRYMRELNASRAYICRSCQSRRYWRHDLWPTYKQSHGEKPAQIDNAWAGLAQVGIVKELRGMEADDLVGMFATSNRVAGRKIIVADDKDILTIPGLHHRPKYHPAGVTQTVTEADAGFAHLWQTLTGKLSDGRPGLPGCSHKTAAKLIDAGKYATDPASQWAAIVAAFEKKGLTALDALIQARIARICRDQDFDWDTLSVIDWQPPHVDYRPAIFFDADQARETIPVQLAEGAGDPIPSSLFGESTDGGPAAGWPS